MASGSDMCEGARVSRYEARVRDLAIWDVPITCVPVSGLSMSGRHEEGVRDLAIWDVLIAFSC